VSSDVHPRSVEPGHLDDFKHQVERKQREVSELVLDMDMDIEHKAGERCPASILVRPRV
jgi:hypothetical protein